MNWNSKRALGTWTFLSSKCAPPGLHDHRRPAAERQSSAGAGYASLCQAVRCRLKAVQCQKYRDLLLGRVVAS